MQGSTNVCGESDKNLVGGCSGLLTFESADAFCMSRGARLCSELELLNDEARSTGCSLDMALVWSSTSCGATGHTQVPGSTFNSELTQCGANDDLSYVRCCADDFPKQSESTCGDLGWSNANQHGSSYVCGESDDDLGGCNAASTWEEADDICKASGARLCTLSELKSDETRGTGCQFDSKMIWSSTACGTNEHALGIGGTLYGSQSECQADNSRNAVRCCADVTKAISAKSCGELGWSNANQFGSASVCGESDLNLGGCSRWGSWEDANTFCTDSGARLCTLSELMNDEARETGCSLDSNTLWTKDACGSNAHFVGMGSSALGPWYNCKVDSTPRKARCCADTNTAVALAPGGRIGARRDPTLVPTSEPSLMLVLQPPSQPPQHVPTMHPTPLPVSAQTPTVIKFPSPIPTHLPTALVSESTCEELGWANASTFGSASVCGASKPGLKGCSGLLSWSDAESFCTNGENV
jgi:hypothetical protein